MLGREHRPGIALAVIPLLASVAAADGRAPGSVLVYPIQRSGEAFTIVSVTNVALESAGFDGTTNVHFQFVNVKSDAANPFAPATCTIANTNALLTAADTHSFVARCVNADGPEGYVVATAQDPALFDVAWAHDYLVGSALVVNSSNSMFSINALPFTSPRPTGAPTDLDQDEQLDFDGFEYEGLPEELYLDAFIAVPGSSLTLINLTGGAAFQAVVSMDIFNDHEFSLSATTTVPCWREDPLTSYSLVFGGSFLDLNTPDDPLELDLTCDNQEDLETGWARLRGLVASSTVESVPMPSLLGAITAGPSDLFDGAHLLWESEARRFNGDFPKFAADDPEFPPLPPKSQIDPECFFEAPERVDHPFYELGPRVPVAFDASASMDPDGLVEAYAWEFGDGQVGAGETPVHEYARPGTYEVRLTVTDDQGNQDSCTRTVVVQYRPEAELAIATRTPRHGLPATVCGHTARDADGDIVLYRWFVDDTSFPVLETSEPAVELHFRSAGTHDLYLSVVDEAGAESPLSHRIVQVAPIDPSGPSAVIQGPCHENRGHPDVDGGPFQDLTFRALASLSGPNLPLKGSWEFGDGNSSLKAKGVHTYLGQGLYEVSLLLEDAHGNQSEARHRVTCNWAPLVRLEDVSAVFVKGAAITFGVMEFEDVPLLDFTTDPPVVAGGVVVGSDWTTTHLDSGNAQKLILDELPPSLTLPFEVPGLWETRVRVVDDLGAPSNNGGDRKDFVVLP